MRDATVAGVLAALGLVLATSDARAEETPPAPRTASAPASVAGRVAPKVTFEDAIQRTMARNPSNQLAAEDIRRSEALVQQARATWLPTLSANATYTRLDSDRVLADRVIQGADSLNANLLLTVPLISPRAWAATARAKDNREIAKLTFAETRRQVAVSAGRAYLTVIAQRRVLESSEHARDTARAHEQFAKSRLAGGVGNRLDAVRAAQERATTETRVQNQTIALARAQEALGILLGENGPVDAEDTSLGAAPTLASALGEAESKRSDIVASKERAEAARKAVRDSYVDYLPVLSGVVQPFYQNPATLTLPTTGWQAQLLLSLPIFDGGNRYGLRHERSALHEQAKTRVEAALRQARSEVRVAFEAVQRADEALAQAREAAKLAAEALELSQLAYRAGATSNIEVVDAERRARDAETDAAVAEDSARQARLDLLASAGRFP
jgi:outer membrane protein TolC